MALAGKDLFMEDRRTMSGITRELATSLRGIGSRILRGTEIGAGQWQAALQSLAAAANGRISHQHGPSLGDN